MRLENRVALMCGVGPRMGRASAVLFAQEGAQVVVAARRQEQLADTAAQTKEVGKEALVVPTDVSKPEEVERLLKEVTDRYGRIDVLYDGTGGFWEPTRKFADVDPGFWNTALANTLNSAYNLTQGVRPLMAKQGGGSIVFIGASFNVRQAGNAAYNAAKSGLIGYGQSLARELYADNIRVNVIASGLIRATTATGRILPPSVKLARVGAPEDIAHAALYFACDESAWVTGQVMSVEGGVDVAARGLKALGE